ncbi:MAG: S8 family serine peptidase [Planctomycetota bacterium]
MPRASILGALVAFVPISIIAQTPPAPAPDAAADTQLRLRFATFDPLRSEPAVPEALRSGPQQHLWIVQFQGTPTQRGRDAIAVAGGEVHRYLPDNAYVVRMPATGAMLVRELPAVRWVGAYHPAYRLDPDLQAPLQQGQLDLAIRYNMVVVDKLRDKPALGAAIRAMGGFVDHEQPGSLLYTVTLTGAQLVQAAGLDQVLWIDRWTPSGEDMNNARIQGGGNYIETQGGYTGQGINAHIYEGIEATHQDFTGGATNVRSGGGADTHGHCTAGIVFGNGTSNAIARGMAPNCNKFYTQYSSVTAGWSRWQVVNELVNVYNVDHTTASWGDVQVTTYTSVSADADDIIFDNDIPWTQSQSNTGSQLSRPQAWAKNIFSIGGVQHFDDSNPANDSYLAGGASRGPAADGRIKPDLCAYYDAIATSDRTGTAGYSTGNWYASFGGTSGATPICAGHNVLAIQMFTDDTGHPGVGAFGNPLRNPGGSKHSNRPHFPTLKALEVTAASQYPFTSSSTDNRREHQGWGFPNLQTMYDNRNSMFIIDETDVLTQGQTTAWDVSVAPGTPQLKICMSYSEPAANPGANPTLINNLSIRVTSPTNTVYWGNNGLNSGNWSVAGGTEDAINPIECVFVQNPTVGTWTIEVIATSVVMDNHVETPAMDADYGLVVIGATGGPSTAAIFATYGQGCAGSTSVTVPCVSLNAAGGTLSNTTGPKEYLAVVSSSGAMQITDLGFYMRSTGGTVNCPVRIYTSIASGSQPLATGSIAVGPTAGLYRTTFSPPISVGGAFFVAIDVSALNAVVPNLTSGTSGVMFSRTPLTGAWTFEPSLNRPAYEIGCVAGTTYFTPTLGHVGLPVLGTSYDVTLSSALASAPAFMMSGYSDSVFNGTPLPYQLPGAAGCEILAAPQATHLVFTSATGTATDSFGVPSSPSFIGLDTFHQWAVLDPANSLGIVVSNAGRARAGN